MRNVQSSCSCFELILWPFNIWHLTISSHSDDTAIKHVIHIIQSDCRQPATREVDPKNKAQADFFRDERKRASRALQKCFMCFEVLRMQTVSSQADRGQGTFLFRACASTEAVMLLFSQ